MGGVEDAIADGVGAGGIGEVVVPVLGVELTGDDRRACSVAILEDLEKITPLGVGDGSDGEVVDDEDVEASEAREDAWKRAVGPCEAELIVVVLHLVGRRGRIPNIAAPLVKTATSKWGASACRMTSASRTLSSTTHTEAP
jgi:hypothetical protein